MTKLLTTFVLAACLSVPAVVAASPITYTSTHSVGTGTVNLSITTDGTIGVLGAGNIVDWLITMTVTPDSFTLRGPNSGNNSGVLILGSSLIGSATDLLFDTSLVPGNVFMIQSPSTGSGGPFWCLQTNSCFDASGPAEGMTPTQFPATAVSPLQGRYVVATAVAAVPEPGTLSLLALGGAAIAFRLRRGRRSA